MGAREWIGADAASPVLAEVRAQYGDAFDAALERNVADALAEDVGPCDQTGRLVLADDVRDARLVVREDAVLCGVLWFDDVMRRVDPRIDVRWHYREGDRMAADTVVCTMRGPVRSLLTAERNAMNFLQLLSGVATATRRYVEEIAHTTTRVLDTRKTLPGRTSGSRYMTES
jgi:nicotinate-nucleotide pyrophosphorylase (carboxylating)